jgi:hypothetical protein
VSRNPQDGGGTTEYIGLTGTGIAMAPQMTGDKALERDDFRLVSKVNFRGNWRILPARRPARAASSLIPAIRGDNRSAFFLLLAFARQIGDG